jgi:hypothetical protein
MYAVTVVVDEDVGFLGLGWCCCLGVLLPLVLFIPMFIGMYRAFEKAGVPGWAALVPVYNLIILARIADKEDSDGLMCLIPIAGIYFLYLLLVDFCRKFRKDSNFAIGLLLLPMVFWPILGFGDARHASQIRADRQAEKQRRRRVQRLTDRDEDDEDEDDRPRRYRDEETQEDRPRRRRRDEDDD